MTDERDWRDISPEESAMVTAIVSTVIDLDGPALTRQLDGAVVTATTQWILDVRVQDDRPRSRLADGPFPARAFVPSNASYQGEIIIWIRDGRLNGLEYAWVTDGPPSRWPEPAGMEIIPNKIV